MAVDVAALRAEYTDMLAQAGHTRTFSANARRALRDEIVAALQAADEVALGTRTSSGVAINHPTTGIPVSTHRHSGVIETQYVNERGKAVVSQSRPSHTHSIEWPTGITADVQGFVAIALLRWHTRAAMH